VKAVSGVMGTAKRQMARSESAILQMKILVLLHISRFLLIKILYFYLFILITVWYFGY
jgi:hypothetical protein